MKAPPNPVYQRVRGASLRSRRENTIRVLHRDQCKPQSAYCDIGFRCTLRVRAPRA